MASSTEDGNHTITNQEYYCNLSLVGTPKITVLILALPLFISAVLGNVLIIVGLRKVSSPHPPSKLLLNCLACTDLATSLISYPLYGALSFSPEQSIVCYTLWILLTISALVFRGVSLTTTTAVSVRQSSREPFALGRAAGNSLLSRDCQDRTVTVRYHSRASY